MFSAGERIADGRITTIGDGSETTSSISSGPAETTDKDVDAVIASEKTVSRHARVLDDELAELEVRINKSAGESRDSPGANPVFDIFSGPEVYNPNVDPETAVNWPGALPGTKNIRLPKELDEAVKQARFAAEVLLNVKSVDSDEGASIYMLGDRKFSDEQIANLRTVVDEAVEIGLIDDPLIIKEEAARLHMLLDELTQQPDGRMREIASNYKDLLLSDNFVLLVKQRLNEMVNRDLEALRRDDDSLESVHAREREI